MFSEVTGRVKAMRYSEELVAAEAFTAATWSPGCC